MRKFLTVICAVILLMNAMVSAGKLENDKAKYDKAAADALAKSDWLQTQINSISEIKRVLDEEAEVAVADFNAKQSALDATVNRIAEQESELAELEKDYNTKLVKLEKRVRDIYINGQISYLDVMFGAQDFGDFLTRMDLLKRVLEQDSELVTNAMVDKTGIEDIISQLEEDKIVQAQQADFAAKARDIKLAKVARQQELIDRMQNDKAVFDRQYDEMMAASKEVERLIQESKFKAAAEAEARRQAAAERAAQQRRLEQQRQQQAQENPIQGYVTDDGDAQVYSPAITGSGEMIWPVVGEITSEFGWRSHPIFGGQKFHSGMDIAADYGEPIRAARGGVVTHSGWIDGYGNTVMIDHGGGLVTLYGHNQSLAVDVGQAVRQGEVVAYCGSTGNSTGPHCHFEVRKNGEPVSPLDYL